MEPLRIILLIIAFIVILSLLQFLLSIHPPRYYDLRTPEDLGLSYEKVSFRTSDGVKIAGWWIPGKKANGTVIVGHGYPFDKGNILPNVVFLHPEYNLLLYDHRYFGESEGYITTVGIKEVYDVKAAVDFAKKKARKPIALYGFSLSAFSMLMSNTDVKAIIAEAPYANLHLMIKRVYSLFGPIKWPFVEVTRALGWLILGVDAKKVAVKEITVPVLLIHGDKDSQIPVEHSYLIKDNTPEIELWIVEGADHGEVHALLGKEYEKRVKGFLKKHMR